MGSHILWSSQSLIEVWGEGSTWEELIKAVHNFPIHLKQPWSTSQTSFKMIVDGWGKAIKQQQQLEIIEKFDFLQFTVGHALISSQRAVLI